MKKKFMALALVSALILTGCSSEDIKPGQWLVIGLSKVQAVMSGAFNYADEHQLPERYMDALDVEQPTPTSEPPVDFNKVGDKGKELLHKADKKADDIGDKGRQVVRNGKSKVNNHSHTPSSSHKKVTVPPRSGRVPKNITVAMKDLRGRQRSELSMAGYSRDVFPHWKKNPAKYGWGNQYPASCTTRKAALIRDGKHVKVTGKNCKVSGVWTDPYGVVKNGRVVYETISNPSQVDIDHIVPLALVWRSGGKTWTTDKRMRVANDPLNLIATGRTSNRSKGDQSVVTYMPPLGKGARVQNRCEYIQRYILVKSKYKMTVTPKEYKVLQKQVSFCWTGR